MDQTMSTSHNEDTEAGTCTSTSNLQAVHVPTVHTVDPSADPFAQRPGRTLQWTKLSLAVKDTSTTTHTSTSSSGTAASSTTSAKCTHDDQNAKQDQDHGSATATDTPPKQRKKKDKIILDSLSGKIEPRQLSAIMGHSGAGKTSLLNVLAGKIRSSGEQQDSITLDGVPIDPTSITVRRKIAFVAQRDTLLSTATPREAIRFSAKLRLSSDLSDHAIDALVTRILKELRLEHVADSLTGGEHLRGLSGGELRRLSLGIELVVRPSLLFCDEVTSGLDSHNATAVMEVLKQVANCGATVLSTIHQPSSRVFNLMDHLILLNQGRCMYQGPPSKVPQHFALRGFEVPLNYNPADFILEVSQTESMQALQEAGFFQVDQDDEDDEEAAVAPPRRQSSLVHRVSNSLSRTFSRSTSGGNGSSSAPKPRLSIFDTLDAASRVSLWTEIRLQVQRDIQKLARDGHAMTLRFMIIVVGSAITAFAFSGAGGPDSLHDASAFSSHVGAAFFLIMTCMVAVQVIMLDQVEARPLFVREFETDHYRMLSYGLGKIATEAMICLAQVLILLLIVYWSIGLQGNFGFWLLAIYAFTMIMTAVGVALAASTRDARDAKELIPMTMLPQILFCGFFVSTLPDYLTWLQWFWPLTYTFRLILSEEFASCVARDEELTAANHCAQSLLQTILNANGSIPAIYNDNSLLILPQTGRYQGTEDIFEYYALFTEDSVSNTSFLVNGCALDGSMQVQLNDYDSETGICDVTMVEVERGEVNPILVRDEYREAPFVEYTHGHRFRYTTTTTDDDDGNSNDNPETIPSAQVISHALYLPEHLNSGVVANAANHTTMVDFICTTLHDRCPASFAKDGFADLDECRRTMGTLPVSTTNSAGISVADGNSTNCRFIHSSLAQSNAEHCPHISYLPQVDKNGYTKCSESYNMTYSDFFSAKDEAFFDENALRYGLGEHRLVYGLSANDTTTTTTCRSDFANRQAELAASIPEDYETTKACVAYLETQNATGDNNAQYWLTLFAMYVAIRSVGLYLLRNLVAKKTKIN